MLLLFSMGAAAPFSVLQRKVSVAAGEKAE